MSASQLSPESEQQYRSFLKTFSITNKAALSERRQEFTQARVCRQVLDIADELRAVQMETIGAVSPELRAIIADSLIMDTLEHLNAAEDSSGGPFIRVDLTQYP